MYIYIHTHPSTKPCNKPPPTHPKQTNQNRLPDLPCAKLVDAAEPQKYQVTLTLDPAVCSVPLIKGACLGVGFAICIFICRGGTGTGWRRPPYPAAGGRFLRVLLFFSSGSIYTNNPPHTPNTNTTEFTIGVTPGPAVEWEVEGLLHEGGLRVGVPIPADALWIYFVGAFCGWWFEWGLSDHRHLKHTRTHICTHTTPTPKTHTLIITPLHNTTQHKTHTHHTDAFKNRVPYDKAKYPYPLIAFEGREVRVACVPYDSI